MLILHDILCAEWDIGCPLPKVMEGQVMFERTLHVWLKYFKLGKRRHKCLFNALNQHPGKLAYRTWVIECNVVFFFNVFGRKKQQRRESNWVLHKASLTGHGKCMARSVVPQRHCYLVQHHQDSHFRLPLPPLPFSHQNLLIRQTSISVSLQLILLPPTPLSFIIRWNCRRHHHSLFSSRDVECL